MGAQTETELDHEGDHARVSALEREPDELVEGQHAIGIAERVGRRRRAPAAISRRSQARFELAQRGLVLQEGVAILGGERASESGRVGVEGVQNGRDRAATDLGSASRASVHGSVPEEAGEGGVRVDCR